MIYRDETSMISWYNYPHTLMLGRKPFYHAVLVESCGQFPAGLPDVLFYETGLGV